MQNVKDLTIRDLGKKIILHTKDGICEGVLSVTQNGAFFITCPAQVFIKTRHGVMQDVLGFEFKK